MPRSPLSEPDVLSIKRRLWLGEPCETIALDFEVTTSTIRSIQAGVRWKTVPWPEKDAKGKVQTGAIPRERAKVIHKARVESRREATARTIKKLTRR